MPGHRYPIAAADRRIRALEFLHAERRQFKSFFLSLTVALQFTSFFCKAVMQYLLLALDFMFSIFKGEEIDADFSDTGIHVVMALQSKKARCCSPWVAAQDILSLGLFPLPTIRFLFCFLIIVFLHPLIENPNLFFLYHASSLFISQLI